jgi:transcriptional regulator with XRE-family HTH domain
MEAALSAGSDHEANTDSLGIMREDHVASRIEYEIDRRGWSQERLAAEMAEVGHPLHQSAISKIINPKGGRRRTVSVDEALGFAKVFGISLEDLLLPLSAVENAEIRRLLQRISAITAERIRLIKESEGLWKRVVDLLSLGSVQFAGLVIDHRVEHGFNRPHSQIVVDQAEKERILAHGRMLEWVQRTSERSEILATLDIALMHGAGIRSNLIHRRDLLDQLIDLLSQLDKEQPDLEAMRQFSADHREELMHSWGMSVFAFKAFDARLAGESEDENISRLATSLALTHKAVLEELIGEFTEDE